MIDGVEQYYQQIAESISREIPEPWSNALVDAIFYTEQIVYTGEYIPSVGVGPKSFALDRDGRRAFMNLREAFKNAGKPLWCRAHFEVNSEGKFKMQWGYEDCDENGFARFDEQVELKRMKALRERLR